MDRDAAQPAAQLRLVQVLSGHEDRVWCCAWSPTGATLATCGGDRTVRLWTRVDGGANQADTRDEAPQWACAATLEELHNRTIRTVAWSPCGRLLASASFDGSVGIWERDTRSGDWACVATLEGHENEVKAAAWSPCGRYLATCGRDKTVWVWDRGNSDADFECAAVLQGHTADVKSVCWCPVDTGGDGPVVMSCSYDDSLRLWREQAGDDDWECMQVLPGAATAAKEAATQARKAAQGKDEEAIAMLAADAALRAAASGGGHAGTVWAAAWHPSGGQVVTVSDDKAIKMWTWAHSGDTSRLVPSGEVADAHDRTVYCVDWHPGGQLLVTGGGDDALKVWRVNQSGGAPLTCACSVPGAHSSDVNSVRWHPGGRYLASCGDDGAVRVWAWDASGAADTTMGEAV